jgi:phospholipase C
MPTKTPDQPAARLERAFVKRKLPDATVEATPTDNIPQIKHVVVLMMENHSFDNYLGMLGPERGGFEQFDGEGRPVATNPSAGAGAVALWHRTDTAQVAHIPTQSWRGSRIQYGNGANDGFVKAAEELVDDHADPGHTDPADTARRIAMAYWTEAELPFYYSLARTFPLATRWFSSCLGPTFPNRRFLLAGTAHGLMDDVLVGMLDTPPKGTILDVLSAQRISWVNYHNVPSGRLLATRLFGNLGVRIGRWLRLLTAGFGPLQRFVIGNLQFTANLYPTGFLRVRSHTAPLKQFFADAAAGTLPFLSIVDPDFNHWSEENKQDIQKGEGFAAEVIDKVMDGPGWANTVLIWTYDEHGGYYDHVPPPPAVAPDDVKGRSLLDLPGPVKAVLRLVLGKQWQALRKADDEADRSFDRYGFRVPTVVVSPFAKQNCVTDTVFDHTSILKLIEDKWGLAPLTERDKHANSLLEMLDFDTPGFANGKPALAKPAKPWSLADAG